MRTFNVRLVLWLAGIFLVVAVGVHFLHDYQVHKHAVIYWELAQKEDKLAREGEIGSPEWLKTAKDALSHYRRYLSLQPKDVAARAEYGKFLYYVRDLKSTYAQLERVLREDEDNDEIRNLQVDVTMAGHLYPDAEAHLDYLLKKIDPNDKVKHAELLEKLGLCQALSIKFEDAKATFESAIALAPERPTTYVYLAELLRDQMQKRDEAKIIIDKMVQVKPDDPAVLVLRGRYLMQDNDPVSKSDNLKAANVDCDAAVAKLDDKKARAEKLTPEDADGYAWAADCKQRQGDYAVARTLVEAAIAIDPEVAERYRQLAECELFVHGSTRAGQDAAIQAIRNGITAIPAKRANLDLRWQLADLLMTRRLIARLDVQQKEQEIGELRRASADMAQHEADLEKLRTALKEVQTELATIQSELKTEQPDSPFIAFLDARDFFEEQRWSDARQILEKIRPKLARSVLRIRVDSMLGRCYSQLDDQDLSLSTYQRMLADNQLNTEARRAYAETLAGLGRLAEARDEYEQLIRMLDSKDDATRKQNATSRIEARKRYCQLVLIDTLRQPDSRTAPRSWDRFNEVLTAVEQEVRPASVPETEVPNDPFVRIMRADQLVAQGKLDDAKGELEAACTAMPNEQSVWMARAQLAQRIAPPTPADGTPPPTEGPQQPDPVEQRTAYAESAQIYADIEQKFGDSLDLRMARASLLIREKGPDGVPELAQFVENIDKFSPAEQAQLNLRIARLCLAVKGIEQGLQYGREAARLSPRSLRVRTFLLQIARSDQNPELAQQLVDEIQKIEMGSPKESKKDDGELAKKEGPVTLYSQAVYELTSYAKDQTDAAALDRARGKLLQAQVLREKWVQIPLLLGEIALRQSPPDDNEMLNQYRRAIELGNRDAPVIGAVAQSLIRRNRLEEAADVMRLLDQDPSEVAPEVAAIASRVSYFREDPEQALEWAEVPVERGTKQLAHYLWLSRMQAANQKWNEAKQTIRDGIKLGADPDNPDSGKDVAYLDLIRLLMEEAKAADKASSAADNEALVATTEGRTADAEQKAIEAKAKKDEANALREEAKQTMAEAEKIVPPERQAQTVAQCLDILGDAKGALEKFDTALKETPTDTVLLEAAARFYLKYGLNGKAKEILQRFVNPGDLGKDKQTLAWARLQWAQIQGRSDNYQEFLQAIKGLNDNLKGDFPKILAMPEDLRLTLEDLRQNVNVRSQLELRAQLLAARGLLSLQKEAVKILEWLATSRDPMELDTKFLLGQLYLAIGDWVKASAQMVAVVREADKSKNDGLPLYLDTYINALLAHYEATAAKQWVRLMKQTAPKAFDTYVLEARTLVPKKRPGSDAVAPPWQLDEAIQILQSAEQNKEVRALARRDATEEEDADAKKGTIVQVLEDWLQETVDSRPTDDPQPLKDLIEQYYRDIVKDNPARQLTQVPYLVRQGRRGEAANLIAKHWESTPLGMLITACGTVLAVSDKERQGLSAEQLAELDKQLAETEGILQKSLLKCQGELESAAAEVKPQKQAEVLAITSVMANHYVNMSRYPEAVAMYTEILKHQQGNVLALNNRAMILAARLERLDEAQSDISKAIERLGPLPMIVDSQAMVFLAAGKKPEALAAAKRVISEKPDRLDPAVDKNLAKQWGGYYFHLALISDANDDAAGAADAMREAKKLGFGEADVFDLERLAWKNLVAKLGV